MNFSILLLFNSRPRSVKRFNKFRQRTPQGHFVNVPIGVSLLSVLGDDFRMARPELRFVRAKLLSPFGIWPLHKLVSQQVKGLAQHRVPVGSLATASSRESPIGKHMHACVRLELVRSLETADVSNDAATQGRGAQ